MRSWTQRARSARWTARKSCGGTLRADVAVLPEETGAMMISREKTGLEVGDPWRTKRSR